MTAEIRHPDVATCEILCLGAPEEYAGTLTDGRHFYLSMREGWASLTLGRAAGEHLTRVPDVTMPVGGEHRGLFSSDAERDAVFTTLLDLFSALHRGVWARIRQRFQARRRTETVGHLHDRLTPGVTTDLPEYGLTVTRWSDR
jgi:hypothetical protein